MVVVNS